MKRFFERFAALEAPDPDAFTTIGAGLAWPSWDARWRKRRSL
jgi:hypothetical protein